MAADPTDLESPTFLVATPQVLDPFFNRSVVLLLHHGDEGSFGFNLNRPTELELSEVLNGLEITWSGDPEHRAFFGGPVQPQLGTVLFKAGDDEEIFEGAHKMAASEVYPGLQMTQHVDDLALLAGQPPASFRLYLGYAGWGAGQLIEEILRNDWILVPVIEELLFSRDPQSLWASALERVGVDPSTLPSWTEDQSKAEAN